MDLRVGKWFNMVKCERGANTEVLGPGKLLRKTGPGKFVALIPINGEPLIEEVYSCQFRGQTKAPK